MKYSKKWLQTREIYLYFIKDCDVLVDISEEAEKAQYLYESTGKPYVNYYDKDDKGRVNGFALGKHLFDLSLTGWREGLKEGWLIKNEIYEDFMKPESLYKIEDYREIIKPEDLVVPYKLYDIVRTMSAEVDKDGLYELGYKNILNKLLTSIIKHV